MSVPDPGGDEQTGGQPDGKPEDVNGRKDSIPPEIAECKLYIVF